MRARSNTAFVAAVLTAVVALTVLLPIPASPGGMTIPGLPLCLFKFTTGIPCPLCGLTRSFICTGHLEIGEALSYHPLGPFLWLASVAGLAVCLFRILARKAGDGRKADAAGGVPAARGRSPARFAWIPAAGIILAVWAVKVFLISRCYW